MEEQPEKKESVWTPELVRELGDRLVNLADKLISYKRNEAEANNKYLHTVTKHNRDILVTLVVFLGIIIAFMSYLTLSGRVSGDALLFLVGTVTGYVIILIQRLIFGGNTDKSTQEET